MSPRAARASAPGRQPAIACGAPSIAAPAGLAVLAALLRRMAGPGVAVALRNPAGPSQPLMPQEAPAMARAVPTRLREFAAGRSAARQAMAALGLPPLPLPQGHDRAPQWPTGVVGSISHCEGACAAIVARRNSRISLGLDLEPDLPLPEELAALIASADELSQAPTLPPALRGLLGRLIFSAKECAFKCQYPLTGTMIGFDAMRIEIVPCATPPAEISVAPTAAEGRFNAVFLEPVGRFAEGDRIKGRFGIASGLIVTQMGLCP